MQTLQTKKPVSAPVCDFFPKKINTKIVGTTFEGRQLFLAECRKQGIRKLNLIPDPLNKYDSYAVAVEAQIRRPSGTTKTVRLGYISNSDRVCSDCGTMVGGSAFERSKTIQCPGCGYAFGFDDNVIISGPDGDAAIICPQCGNDVELHANKLVVCPKCGGTDFGRAGLATRLFRAIAAGISYTVRVEDYTGGDVGPGGKVKTLGCNIRIERVEP